MTEQSIRTFLFLRILQQTWANRRLSEPQLLFLSGLSLTLMVFLTAGLSLAQNPSLQENSAISSVVQPKLFWYERTFGETEKAYFADTAHLYNPEGVGVDSTGNLWVAETLGARVMKYSGGGTFLMSIGTAGRVWLADNKHISVPMDVAVDGAGNIWAVDKIHCTAWSEVRWRLPDAVGVTWEGGQTMLISTARGLP
jgi:hypothetical protein